MKTSFFLIATWLLISACQSTAKISEQKLKVPEELLGAFSDDYGSNYIITSSEWMHGKSIKYHLLQFNKEGNYFIARNADTNPLQGGLFTRIDIVYFDNMEQWKWGYCLTEYKAATLKDAKNALAANKQNLLKGCNGFPFTRMKKQS